MTANKNRIDDQRKYDMLGMLAKAGTQKSFVSTFENGN